MVNATETTIAEIKGIYKARPNLFIKISPGKRGSLGFRFQSSIITKNVAAVIPKIFPTCSIIIAYPIGSL